MLRWSGFHRNHWFSLVCCNSALERPHWASLEFSSRSILRYAFRNGLLHVWILNATTKWNIQKIGFFTKCIIILTLWGTDWLPYVCGWLVQVLSGAITLLHCCILDATPSWLTYHGRITHHRNWSSSNVCQFKRHVHFFTKSYLSPMTCSVVEQLLIKLKTICQ